MTILIKVFFWFGYMGAYALAEIHERDAFRKLGIYLACADLMRAEAGFLRAVRVRS